MASSKAEDALSEDFSEMRAILGRLTDDMDMFEDSGLPSFAMNEAERVQKSFQERRSDVESAMEWIKMEIKSMKAQDQNLMKQFVKLRSLLNSLKSRPVLGRNVSLPEGAMSPYADLHWVEYPTNENLCERGNRRRTQSAFAGRLQGYILDWSAEN